MKSGIFNLVCYAAFFNGKGWALGESCLLPLPVSVSEAIERGSSFGEEIRSYRQGRTGIETEDLEELTSRTRSFSEAIESALLLAVRDA